MDTMTLARPSPSGLVIEGRVATDMTPQRTLRTRFLTDGVGFQSPSGADRVITLCDTVKPYSAHFPDNIKHDHWSIPNPDALVNDATSQLEAYAEVRDKLKERIVKLLESISGE